MGKDVVHATEKKSFWSGRITALCGLTAEAGTYTTLWFSSGPTCPSCKRIKKQRKQATKEGRR